MTKEEIGAIIQKEYLCVDRDCNIEKSCGRCDLMMPSKEPILEAYKMVMDMLKQEPCEDAISRQAVMDALCDGCELFKNGEQTCFSKCEEYHFLATLPSVKPQEPTGHCEDCKHFCKLPYHADTLGKCVHHTGFYPKGDWYCADYEPQEVRDKE